MITPLEYRKFCETTYCAPPSVNRDEYLRLLLIEEVGEVASLFAKSLRDGHPVDMDRLKKELGDVLWASTMLGNASSPWIERIRATNTLRNLLFEVMFDSGGVIFWAQNLCLFCGFSPEEVALANVAKLRDRQARSVLHGAGDER